MIKAILAVENSYGMGFKGTLPWPKNKEDLKQFKDKTTGHIVVMGSKTWNDPCFPAPLPNRENYVITSQKGSNFEGAKIIKTNVKERIKRLAKNSKKDVWIIGGANLFKQLHDIIDEYHITIISNNYECDVFFDLPLDDFERTELKRSETGNYYKIMKRKGK